MSTQPHQGAAGYTSQLGPCQCAEGWGSAPKQKVLPGSAALTRAPPVSSCPAHHFRSLHLPTLRLRRKLELLELASRAHDHPLEGRLDPEGQLGGPPCA